MNFNKKAQGTMSMPFGIIFAIFLIVVFIIIAFIVGKHFWDIQKCSSVGLFYEDLQTDIDELWFNAGTAISEINLPGGIKKVCFADLDAPITNYGEEHDDIQVYISSDGNTFLVPSENTCGMNVKQINHINISEITKNQNPYCINTTNDIKLKKGFYDGAVLVS